ncbi:MAG: cytochrome P450 [Frankiaceae bacterium]
MTVSVDAAPPVYRGHPLLGVGPEFRRDIFGTLLRAADVGPVVRFRLPPGVPIRSYGIFSPEATARVLVGEAEGYRKDSLPYQETAALFGDGLLTSQDERWRRQRRLVAPLFTPHRLAADYVPLLEGEADRLRERWLAAPSAIVDVHAESVRYTLRAIGRILFGEELDGILPTLTPAFAAGNAYLRHRITASVPLPRTWPTPANLAGRKARAKLYAVVDAVVAARRDRPGAGDDLLGRLLAARDPDTGGALSADEVRDQVLIFLLAGHETTSTTLAFTLQLLARHPQIQQRVAAEVDRTGAGGRLPYTQQVINEALRLYPPAYAISRYTKAGGMLGGMQILPESNIAIGTYALHRDRQVWPEPERFDPGRFADAAAAGRSRYSFLPFGGGPRICIGAQLAMAEASIAVARLVREHTICPAGAAAGPVPAGVVLRPGGPMPHQLVPRR